MNLPFRQGYGSKPSWQTYASPEPGWLNRRVEHLHERDASPVLLEPIGRATAVVVLLPGPINLPYE